MLTWAKALFTSNKILEEDPKGEYVPFTDIIGQGTITKLYNLFETYINQDVLPENFHEVIKRDLFPSFEWENTLKVMHNLKIKVGETELLQFLESNCYRVWFAQQSLENKVFNNNEKSAMVGFTFFLSESEYDEEYPYESVHEQVNEQRQVSPEFNDFAFNANIKSFICDYQKFTSKQGTVTL